MSIKLTKEELATAIEACLNSIPVPADQVTPEMQLVRRAQEAVRFINRQFAIQIQEQPGLVLNKKQSGLILSEMLLEQFRSWDKEELLFLVVMLHLELIMEQM
jgi:hypothetical protein